MKPYDTILFDLDGTLTESSLGITNSVAYALRKMGHPVPSREALHIFIGPPLSETFTKCCGMTPEEATQAIACYREYYHDRGIFENAVYEGIEPLLKKLRDAGKTLILATSKPEEVSIQILDHFGLSQYFTHIAGATMDDTRSKKSDVIAYALKGCQPADLRRTVMVGDRHHDIDGAKHFGMKSIGVTYGFGSAEELQNAGADYIVHSPREVADLILNK